MLGEEVARTVQTHPMISPWQGVPEDKKHPPMATEAETDAAYAEVMKTPEGTPEYHQALEDFFSLLFPNRNPPVTMPPTINS